jgi:hypothetical protein
MKRVGLVAVPVQVTAWIPALEGTARGNEVENPVVEATSIAASGRVAPPEPAEMVVAAGHVASPWEYARGPIVQ